MTFEVFKPGDPDALSAIEVQGGIETKRGAGYVASPELATAVNVALALGRPLLVSGEPGCGKTDLGYAIARKLGVKNLYFFTTQSNSQARDLFYDYDAVGRFQMAQLAAIDAKTGADAARNASRFIHYAALGRAILDAHEKPAVEHLENDEYRHPGEPQRSIVVIDEIDKAPRDFPNDVLNHLEDLWFRVPELAGADHTPETPRKDFDREIRPIVLLTSNSEKMLPDAFLRRCAFHHIDFPDRGALETIVLRWFKARPPRGMDAPEKELVSLAADFVLTLRDKDLAKKPGTGELINFITAIGMARRAQDDRSPWDSGTFRRYALLARSTLAKSNDDNRELGEVAANFSLNASGA